jgi:PPOX class probable F420-dependent enzyme
MRLDEVDPEILSNGCGVLATVDAVGRPQLTVVWFIVRDGHVLVSINAKRQKARNLQANTEVSFLITHPDTDDYFVEIRGTAELVPDHDYRGADLIGEKYQADFRSFDQPDDGRFIVDVSPVKVLVTDVRG